MRREGYVLPPGESSGRDITIRQIVRDRKAYDLPNIEPLPANVIETRARELGSVLREVEERIEKRKALVEKIDALFEYSDGSRILNGVRLLLDRAPSEVAYQLALNLEYVPRASRYEFCSILLEEAPGEVVAELAHKMRLFPRDRREEIASLFLEKAPQQSAEGLALGLSYIPEDRRESFIHRFLDKVPHEAAGELAFGLVNIPRDRQEWFIRLLLEKAPHEVAEGLARSLPQIPEDRREWFIHLLLDKAPQQAAAQLAAKLLAFPREKREYLVKLLVERAPREIIPELNSIIRFSSSNTRKDLYYRLLDVVPHEAAPLLAHNITYLSIDDKRDLLPLLLDKAPGEAAFQLAQIIDLFESDEQEKIGRLIFEKAPRETAIGAKDNLEYFPEDIQRELKRIIKDVEQKELSDAETRNTALYKGVEDDNFFRKDFKKGGSVTVLFGKSLINKAILRIISDTAFASWMKAYAASEEWKKAGFSYVPIEPIIRAKADRDGKHVRVYTGVLGVNLKTYTSMAHNRKYHQHVMDQRQRIKDVLHTMNIWHGHAHPENFCVLHERKPNGDIDWDSPPRVYCIDFDRARPQ